MNGSDANVLDNGSVGVITSAASGPVNTIFDSKKRANAAIKMGAAGKIVGQPKQAWGRLVDGRQEKNEEVVDELMCINVSTNKRPTGTFTVSPEKAHNHVPDSRFYCNSGGGNLCSSVVGCIVDIEIAWDTCTSMAGCDQRHCMHTQIEVIHFGPSRRSWYRF